MNTLTKDIKWRIDGRRIRWPDERMKLTTIHKLPKENARVILLTWIDNHTTSPFYLGGSQIGFMDEKDLLMFKLGFKVND